MIQGCIVGTPPVMQATPNPQPIMRPVDVPSAVAAMMMTVLIQSGKATMAYGILIAIIIIGLISMIPMLKMKDANAADRMYAD